MRNSIVAAVVLAGFLAPPFFSAQQTDNVAPVPPTVTPAPAPPRRQTQAERDLERASILMATKQYADAAKVYERLGKEDPRNPAYPNFAGIAHLQQTDLQGAKKFFERAVKADKT